MRHPIVRILSVALIAASVFLAVLIDAPQKSSAADSLSTSVIGMFPKEVGEFAYADLKTARKFPWFPQLQDQLLPSRFRQFEKFLASAGVDPNTQVDELAWGGITTGGGKGEDVVGIALGDYDPAAVEDHFKRQKVPMVEAHGYHMYAFGSGSGASDIMFLFMDSNTAAFGNRTALNKLISVRIGDLPSLMTNDSIFPLITDTNGNGFIWAVLNKSYTHLAMQQLIPQASQFPQAAAIINRMHAMTIAVEGDSGVDAHFQAVCNSPDDANLLGAAIQAGVMMRRYQESQTNPAMASALDQVQVQPSGDRLKLDIALNQDQLTALIKSKAFVVPM